MTPIQLTMDIGQYTKLKLLPVDEATGNPAPIDPNVPIETPTDEGGMRLILAPTPEPDGARSVYVIPPNSVGFSKGRIRGDSDPGDEQVFIEQVIELTTKSTTVKPTSLGVTSVETGKQEDLPQEIKDIIATPV